MNGSRSSACAAQSVCERAMVQRMTGGRSATVNGARSSGSCMARRHAISEGVSDDAPDAVSQYASDDVS